MQWCCATGRQMTPDPCSCCSGWRTTSTFHFSQGPCEHEGCTETYLLHLGVKGDEPAALLPVTLTHPSPHLPFLFPLPFSLLSFLLSLLQIKLSDIAVAFCL